MSHFYADYSRPDESYNFDKVEAGKQTFEPKGTMHEKSPKFEAPALLEKQMTNQTITESLTYGAGTPLARETPRYYDLDEDYLARPRPSQTSTTSFLSQSRRTATPAYRAGANRVDTDVCDNAAARQERAAQNAAQQLAAKIEKAKKYAHAREMYSGKAQYQAELDLNDDFVAMAKKHGFMKGDDSKGTDELDVDIVGWSELNQTKKRKKKKKKKSNKMGSKKKQSSQTMDSMDASKDHCVSNVTRDSYNDKGETAASAGVTLSDVINAHAHSIDANDVFYDSYEDI